MIRVRGSADGVVEVGTWPVSAVSTVVVSLVDALAAVDPLSPHRIALRLYDADEAGELVTQLVGVPAADAVRQVAASPTDTHRDVEAEELPPLGQQLVRLCLLRWLRAASPLALPAVVVVAEAGVLAASLSDVLDEDTLRGVLDDLLDGADVIAELAQALARPESSAQDTSLLGPVVSRAVRVLEHVVPWDHPAHDEVLFVAGATAGRLDEASGGAPPRSALVDDLLAGLAAQRTAVRAGAGGGPATAGTAAVDWARVVLGTVSTEEDAVSWRRDGGVVDVRVLPAQGWSPSRSADLVVSLYDATDEEGGPLGSAPLRWDGEQGAYTGSCAVPAGLVPALHVDVHDVRVRTRPLLGVDAQAEAARRWSSRALALARWASAPGPLPVTYRAVDAAGTAQRLYAGAARQHPDPARATELARAEARATRLMELLLRRSGEDEEADELVEGRSEGAPGVEEVDVEPVTGQGPGWRLTDSEQALLAAPAVLAEIEEASGGGTDG